MTITTERFEKVDIDKLIPYARNARTHSKKQVLELRASIREFGFINPIIIDKEFNIIAGHGRILGAKEEGLKEVPCVFVEHLSDAQKKAYILADNRLAMNAGWDEEMLAVELSELEGADFDLSLLGFDESELNQLLHDEDAIQDDEFDIDEELNKPTFTKAGDVWQLGKHRLICGDSTKAETYSILMEDKKANLVITDPPYNVDYEGSAVKIKNDNMENSAFYQFLLDAFKGIESAMAKDASIYVFHADTEGLNFRKAFDDAGFYLSGTCIWKKQSIVLGRSPYQWQHEPVLFGWKKKGKHQWYTGRKESTIWEFDKPKKNGDHPTMKPIPLLAYPIINSSLSNCIVLDAFGGSGSTLIACEQSDRICYTIELDEKFCDVIVKRYIEQVGTSENVTVLREGKTIKTKKWRALMDKQLTLGSLFDGSGGFPLAATLSGIKALWASELEPFCVRVTTKRFPYVKHLGDINHIHGAKIEPVDVITFGSPCQNLSIAGNRKGLDGSQSSLFHQAIRIIKEMREATNDHYPKYIVWENVCGAFSSNQGEDFKSVLEEVIKIKDPTFTLTRPKKWENAGEIMGKDFSLAWRVLDAQYWGVPQRRKRIFLVADFTGGCASKILFESEGLSGYSHESFQAWQETTDHFGTSTELTSQLCLNDQGGQRMDVTENITTTLRASAGKTPLVFENHGQDSRYTGPLEKANTVSATYGTGGNNQPFVIEEAIKTYDIRQTSDGTINTRNHCYETETSRTVDRSGNQPGTNQGGIAVVAIQGSVIGRKDENGPQGSGVNEDVSFTLNTVDHHAIAYSTSKVSHHTKATEELASTLVASDYCDAPTVYKEHSIVRRLTPKECARLQGFPSWWAGDLGIDEPTEEDIAFWSTIFETHRKALYPNKKSKTRNQIIKWLKALHSDAAEYKMWGNGVALPCVVFILSGIQWAENLDK